MCLSLLHAVHLFSCCSLAVQILPQLPAPHKGHSRPVYRHCDGIISSSFTTVILGPHFWSRGLPTFPTTNSLSHIAPLNLLLKILQIYENHSFTLCARRLPSLHFPLLRLYGFCDRLIKQHRCNDTDRGKRSTLGRTCPPVTLALTYPAWNSLVPIPVPRVERPATKHLSYLKALKFISVQ
jgi:hypothetical protein